MIGTEELRQRRWIRLELVAWLGLWLAARALLLLSFADVYAYGEEFEKACASKAMLDGLGVPHHQLAYHYYEGGGFVVSHLDALAFALLGESVLAVKLVALALGAAILAAGWSFCRRAGGLVAARVFALLYVLAPESVQKNSLLALGIHFHALLFIALILGFTLVLAYERDLRARIWFGWGLSAGFGFFFSYQCALPIALSVAVLLYTLRSELCQRASAAGLAGLAAGLAPLAWMSSHVGALVFDIHGAKLVDGTASKIEVLSSFFRSIFAQREPLDSLAVASVLLAPWIVVQALLRSAPARMRAAAWMIVAYMLLFTLAYVGGGFTITRVYHYFLLHRLMPLWLLSVCATAVGVAAARASGRIWIARLAGACVVVPALFGLRDLSRTVHDAVPRDWVEHFNVLARTKGYTYPGYLQKLSAHLAGSRTDKLHVMLGYDDAHPMLLHEGIARALYGDGALSIEQVDAELAGAGIGDRHGFILGLGSLLAVQLKADIPERVRACAELPQSMRDALIEAIGRNGQGGAATQDNVLKEGTQGIAAGLPEAYFRGLGQRLYDARSISGRPYYDVRVAPWMFDHQSVESVLARCPDPPASALRQGYDAARSEHELPAR